MKSLKVIGFLILSLAFLSVALSYGQSNFEDAQIFLEKGVEYGSQGKFKEAKEAFEKALQTDSWSSLIYAPIKPLNLKIIEYVDQQKIKPYLVTDYFKAMHKLGPLISFMGRSPQWEKAIEYYNKIVEQNPEEPWVYFFRGYIRQNYVPYRLQDDNTIFSDYSKAIEINPEFIDAYLERAKVYERKKHYDNAISDYSKVIEINPEFIDAYLERGNYYRRRKQFDNAISDYSKAIELNPENHEIYAVRGGLYYYNQKKYDNAISDFNKVIELKPESTFVHYLILRAHMEQGQYDNALADLSQELEASYDKPGNAIDIYDYITTDNIFESLKTHFDSSSFYDDFLYIWKNTKTNVLKNAGEYFARGYIAFLNRHFDDAIPDFSKAIELNPDSFLYYEFRGKAYEMINKCEKAILDYNKAIKLKPDAPIYYFVRGKAFVCKRQYENAISDYSKALELDPSPNYLYYESRGDAYVKVDKYKEAITDYGKVIEMNPSYRGLELSSIYNKRGDAYDEIDDLENACSDWKKACSDGKGNCEGWSIVNRIRCLGK